MPGEPFENPDPILLEVAKSVCKIKIYTNKGTYISGTGFFLKFFINKKLYHWLVSNEHVITKEMINNKKEINVSFNIERKQLNLRLDTNERYIKTFKENNVDATTVQIRSSDRVYEDYFLEPELEYDNNTLVGKEIFIPQFPASQHIQNARGIISQTKGLSFAITVVTRNLRNNKGAYETLDRVKQYLCGYKIPGCTKMIPQKEGFISETNGIWQYEIEFNLTTPSIEEMEEI